MQTHILTHILTHTHILEGLFVIIIHAKGWACLAIQRGSRVPRPAMQRTLIKSSRSCKRGWGRAPASLWACGSHYRKLKSGLARVKIIPRTHARRFRTLDWISIRNIYSASRIYRCSSYHRIPLTLLDISICVAREYHILYGNANNPLENIKEFSNALPPSPHPAPVLS